MKNPLRIASFATLIAAGCAQTQAQPQIEPPEIPAATEASPAAPTTDPKVARVAVIAIADFHGWLLPLEPKNFNKYYGGIANLAALLEHKEKLDPKNSIIVDNGDMWTGPTVSTILRGEPVIQAYNAIGVTAATVSNH